MGSGVGTGKCTVEVGSIGALVVGLGVLVVIGVLVELGVELVEGGGKTTMAC